MLALALLRLRLRGPLAAQRFGVGQPLDRLDKIAATKKHFQVDWTAATAAADPAVKKLTPWIDGKAVVTGAADRTAADEFAALLAEIRAVRQRDREHVAGAGALDQRVPLVAAHDAALSGNPGISSGC